MEKWIDMADALKGCFDEEEETCEPTAREKEGAEKYAGVPEEELWEKAEQLLYNIQDEGYNTDSTEEFVNDRNAEGAYRQNREDFAFVSEWIEDDIHELRTILTALMECRKGE